MKITITRPGLPDTFITTPVNASLSAPKPIVDGLHAADVGDGKGVLLINLGSKNFPFGKILTDEPVIYTEGTKRDLDTGGTIYIDDDPNGYRLGAQFMLPNEAIPILFFHEDHLEPKATHVQTVLDLTKQVTNLSEILNHPRFTKILQNFEDKGQPLNIPFGTTDMGWLQRHWHRTAGGRALTGWYRGVCERGEGGFGNWNYDALLCLAMNYMTNPQPALWYFGMRSALAHACYGRHWGGQWAGMARYEKGDEYIGQNFAVSWAKQWSGGLVMWWLLSGNEILEHAVDEQRKAILRADPKDVWKGYWGSRIAARYLEECLLHYLVHRDAGLVTKAEQMITNCKNLLDPTETYWPNRGNNGAAEESPWMHAQLVSAIFRWYEHVPNLETNTGFTKDMLCKIGMDVMTTGTTRIYAGKPIMKYRFHTTDVMPSSMHNTAWAVPMLTYMAGHSDQYGALRDEVKTFVTEYAGTTIVDVVNGTPKPISELGYRFPEQGLGWNKVQRFYLNAFR